MSEKKTDKRFAIRPHGTKDQSRSPTFSNEGLIVLWFLIIAGVIVVFVHHNIKRGAEFIRAHIFLSGIEAGFSIAESNVVTLVPITEVPDDVITSAKQRARHDYGGKQVPIIKKAYQTGMVSRLPSWQRKLVMLS